MHYGKKIAYILEDIRIRLFAIVLFIVEKNEDKFPQIRNN